MQCIFSDNMVHAQMKPLTFTRPVSQLRFGILTIQETWTNLLSNKDEINSIGYQTENYLEEKFPTIPVTDNTLTIAGNIKPTQEIVDWVYTLQNGESLTINNLFVAQRGKVESKKINKEVTNLLSVAHPWELFQKNGDAIKVDYDILTKNKTSQPLSDSNRVIGSNNIFIAEGAKAECSIFNTSDGPIYIGKDAEVMEGSIIRGPFALNENAVVKMGAKIYGPTTIGPHCKVGGEISNCIFQAYSNKGHDGFLGNSVIGEWCNFGADSNSSNLKNNYSKIKVHSFVSNQLEQESLTFCGVLMGDHSKTGINTMLNTGTVVGVSANIFGAGFPPKYIPSFSWGGAESSTNFDFDKAIIVAENMMARRGLDLSAADRKILRTIHDELAQ